jgi:DNA invertase Pin-like site-specific DNA recombinase
MARTSRKNLDMATKAVAAPSITIYNAAGYIRLSVEDNKKKGDSVETQKAILQNHIALMPDIKLHDFYIDNGISGSTFERPAFKKMLADAENGVINCIIVKDLSRLGRNAIDTGYYIEKYLPSLKCRFIAISDDFDTSDDTNSGAGVILPIKNIVNEAYALDIARKVKAQQHQAMKSGEYIGPRAPYGYLKAPDNCHKLIIDSGSAPVVRRIYEMFAEGVSAVNIVRYLNEANIPTPTQYHKEIGVIISDKIVGSSAWQSRTVNHILKNEVYAGNLVQGKTNCRSREKTNVDKSQWIRVANTHEAVICPELLAKTQARLKSMVEKAAKKPHKPFTPNIFKGKIYCGHCGANAQRVRGWKRKGENVYAFTCYVNKQKARGSCVATFHMPEEDLITAMLTMIQTHADVVIGKSVALRKNAPNMEISRERVKAEIATLRLESDKNGRMFKSLYESLISGLITGDEYREMREGYETKMRKNLARAAELETKQAEFDKQIADYCELSDLLTDAANGGITAKIVDCLVDKIRIYSDRSMDVDFLFDNGFDLINGQGVAANE